MTVAGRHPKNKVLEFIAKCFETLANGAVKFPCNKRL